MNTYALIMAGGVGTRLWPLSRRRRPKQSLKLIGDRTMFQQAVDRIAPDFPAERILVVTAAEHVDTLATQVPSIPESNFIVEPEGRGTGPCIGLGALHLMHRDPDAIMVVLAADHYIHDTERFRHVLRAAAKIADRGFLVTLGITPSYPATGYGYIKQTDRIDDVDGFGAFRASSFIEKPDLETALAMLDSQTYTWNSGMFVWRVSRILEEFGHHMEELHATLRELDSLWGTADYETRLRALWPKVPKQTIDYGIMEKAEQVAVIPANIGWSDVGSWSSLLSLHETDRDGNIITGQHLGLDTRDTLVLGRERLIATIGVENLIVVDTDDALLICAREREQDVRELVRYLKNEELLDYV